MQRVRLFSKDFDFLLTATLASLFFVYLRFRFNYQFEEAATLESLMNGTAHLPYQYRALVPWIVSCIAYAAPDIRPDAVFALIEALSILGLTLVLRRYLNNFVPSSEACALFALTIFGALPYHFMLYPGYHFWYPYDFPACLLSTLALHLLYQKRFTAYYLVFIVATLNRETSCFLTVLFLLCLRDFFDRRALVTHVSLQFVIWCAVKILLYLAYLDNPGHGLFSDKLSSNVEWLANPELYGALASICGFLCLPVLWRRKVIEDDFVRSSILIFYPFLAGMMFVGNWHETRIFSEILPVLLSGYALLCQHYIAGGRLHSPISAGDKT
jgi:hypothetical protein